MIDVDMKLLSKFYFVVEVRLTTTNQVLLVVGVILWSVAFMVGIILSVIKLKTLVHNHMQMGDIFFTCVRYRNYNVISGLMGDCGVSGWTTNQ